MATASQPIDQPTQPPVGEADPRAVLAPATNSRHIDASRARRNLAQAKREFGRAAADGSAQAAAIIAEYEQAAAAAVTTKQQRGVSVIPPRSAEIARLRVHVGYETLDAKETRREFNRLNATLKQLGDEVICTVDRIVPILSDVQTLTSQRGAARKRVLREAKLPEWTPYLQKYADRFGIGIRQLQRKIAAFRGKKSNPKPAKNADPKPKQESEIEAEVRRRLMSYIESGERYIRRLEAIVYSATVALTDEQRNTLRKPSEEWRKILRYVRGLKAEQETEEAA